MSLASSPYSRSTARGQKANRGHPRSTIVEKKGTLVAPVEGTTRARIVSVERPRTSACIPGQVTLLLDKRQVSLPLPSGKVPKADSGVESPSPSLWTQWTGDITCTSTIRKSVTGLRGFLLPPPQGGIGTKRQFWCDTAPEWQFEGKITGDSRLFAIVNAISGISILERRRLFHLFGGRRGERTSLRKVRGLLLLGLDYIYTSFKYIFFWAWKVFRIGLRENF